MCIRGGISSTGPWVALGVSESGPAKLAANGARRPSEPRGARTRYGDRVRSNRFTKLKREEVSLALYLYYDNKAIYNLI